MLTRKWNDKFGNSDILGNYISDMEIFLIHSAEVGESPDAGGG